MTNANAETYEQRRDREHRENEVKRETIRGIIKGIAEALGGCTVADKFGNDNRTITTPDGFSFHIGWSEYGRDAFTRLNISGEYHAEKLYDHIPYGAIRPSIGVSTAKSPATIAKDIERRFLPEYKALITAARERKAKSDDYANRSIANAGKLAESSGGVFSVVEKSEYSNGPRTPTSNLHMNHKSVGYGNVSVSDESVKIDLSSIPLELASRIMEVMAEYNNTRTGMGGK